MLQELSTWHSHGIHILTPALCSQYRHLTLSHERFADYLFELLGRPSDLFPILDFCVRTTSERKRTAMGIWKLASVKVNDQAIHALPKLHHK